MQPDQAAINDAAHAAGPDNHGHIVFASENRRMAEPTANLADESASPREIRQPGRIDHGGDDDVAVAEAIHRAAPLSFLFGDDPGAAFGHGAAGNPGAPNRTWRGLPTVEIASRRRLEI